VWAEVLKLASHVEGYRWKLVILVALGLGAAFAETVGIGLAVLFLFTILGDPSALGQVDGPLARLVQRFGAEAGADPTLLAGILVILILFSAGLIYAHGVMTAMMANRVAERMRDLVHERFVTVGYRWLQDQEQGALMHTLTTESWLAADAFDNVARIIVHFCAVLVFGVGLLFLSWEIMLTAAIAALVTFGSIRLLFRPIRRFGADLLAENQLLAERMLVSLHGMRTIRAFAQEEQVLGLFSAASAKVRQLAVRAEWLKQLNNPIGEIGSLGTLVVIAVVASRIGIDVPTIIASALLLFRMQPHLRGIDAKRLGLANMSPTLANLRSAIEIDGKIWPTQGRHDFRGFRSEILFEAVSFSHDPRRGPSLDTASFAIPFGKVTSLAGPSGSGKSTIINLLLRLYEPHAGRISVDGEDLLGFTRESWLGRLAIAGQDVELVEGTVAQNIRIARHDATLEELREACALTEILADIEAIPEGFDARIGPGGLSFSGGQRQRIGLARALIRRPEFLILDEAMSALEPALEDRIKARIAKVMEGRTMLVVSHRRDALQDFDSVIRIEGGRIQPMAEEALQRTEAGST
jgi:ATP-binding cassette, subfamily B, bacterial MsbA